MLVGSTQSSSDAVAHQARRTSRVRSSGRRCPVRWWHFPGDRGRSPGPGSRARPARRPRLTEVVVFPTPPFWLATARTRGSGLPDAACGSRVAGAAAASSSTDSGTGVDSGSVTADLLGDARRLARGGAGGKPRRSGSQPQLLGSSRVRVRRRLVRRCTSVGPVGRRSAVGVGSRGDSAGRESDDRSPPATHCSRSSKARTRSPVPEPEVSSN